MAELDGPRWGPRTGAALQLVVLCHGVGADGHDLIDLAPGWAAALPQSAFVAPDAPHPYDMAPMGRQWFSLADRTPSVLAHGVRAAADRLGAFVASERGRLNLPADAVALMGFSQGAMTVLQVALHGAEPPRAVLAYSGALIVAEGITAKPAVLLVHGEQDEVVPVEQTRRAERILRAAGVRVDAAYSPRLGHGIDELGLSSGAMFLQRVFSAP